MAATGRLHIANAATSGSTRFYLPRLVLTRGAEFASGYLEVEGTLLSADLSGFTKLSERLARIGKEGAEELTEVLNNCFDRMIAAVGADGGDILKFGGDALLILYTGAGHTARACRSALAMRALIAEPVVAPSGARVKLRISQGMHAGTFGIFAVRGDHTELVVTGPGTTETVRCESDADAGDILLSAAAAALVDPSWLGRAKSGGRLLRRITIPASTTAVAEPDDDVDTDTLAGFVPAAQREVIALGAPSEHRRVTVAFVKFSHTDTIYEHAGPAEIAARLSALGAATAAACAAHGVHWLASDVYPDGGKFILTAGAPTSAGRDEERMVRALYDILEAGVDLDLRAGVNCGPVFAGNLGAAAQRRTYTVMGDAVNLAARLMQKAESGQLVASDAVLERTRAQVLLEELEPFLVKGKAKPVSAAVVLGIESTEGPAVPSHLPLVGRDAEMAHLRAAVADARERRGRVVEIVGGAGTGKSRLVEELRATEDSLRSFTAICGEYARSTPYFALRVLLRGIAGLDALAAPDVAGPALTEWVCDIAPDLARWLPLIAAAFDADVPPTPDADRIAPEYRRDRTHEAVALLLTAACPTATLFVVEDAHYLDDASRDFLADLAGQPSDRPWLLVVTRHPDTEVFDQGGEERRTRIDLGPLDDRDALELALLAAGDESKLRPGEWEAVTERAAGNPLFVIELASTTRAGSTDALPESVESLVTARIDTLAAEDRLLLREASVLGMVIDVDLCADALDAADVRTPGRWDALDEFVESLAPRRLRFRHRLHQQVAYEGLSYRRRRDAHRRVGDALVRRAGDRPERDAELLSTHYFYAGAHDLAWRYSVIAGDRAGEKYANVEAGEFYRRALESARRLDDVPDTDIARVAESLGDVCELSGRYEDAADQYKRARKLCPARDAQVRLYRKEGVVRERTGRYREALRWYSHGLRLVEDVDDEAAASARAQLALAYAAVRHRQGRYTDSVAWANRAVEDALRSDDRAALARAYFVLDIGHTYLGNPERLDYRGRALPIYEELGDDASLSIVLNNLGLEAYVESQWEDALGYYERSREACERVGDVVGAATAVNNEAEILLDQGHVDRAADQLRGALRVWRAARYPIGVAIACANLGLAEVRAGDVEGGLLHLKEATTLIEELKAGEYVARIKAQQLAAFLYAGLFEDALDRAHEWRDVLDNNEGDEATTVMTERVLAWLLLRVGRLDDAAAFIGDGLTRGEAIGNSYEVALLRHARAELLRARGAADEAAADDERAGEILSNLGVIAPPRVPQPA